MRNQKEFIAPEWFKDAMPNIDLDGELFAGREYFSIWEQLEGPVDEEWKRLNIWFMIYQKKMIYLKSCR